MLREDIIHIYIVKKVWETRLEENRGKSRPNKKLINVIREDLRSCEEYENIFWDKEGWTEIIQVVEPICED